MQRREEEEQRGAREGGVLLLGGRVRQGCWVWSPAGRVGSIPPLSSAGLPLGRAPTVPPLWVG